MLTLVLAEAALETVPKEIASHPSVAKYARRRGKAPERVLLDRSYHHQAMRKLRDAHKRGRPDIVQLSLLAALETPLNAEGLLSVYVHTLGGYVISVDPSVRLPRNYLRFVGLMEQLFEEGAVPPKSEKPLLAVRRQSFESLIVELSPTRVVGFSRLGKPAQLDELVKSLASEEHPVVVVGGFPHGHFSQEVLQHLDELVSIDPEPLEAWVVVSRVVYEFEKALDLPRRRLFGET